MNGADLFLILGVAYLCHLLIKDYKKEKVESRTINIIHYKENN